MSAKDKNSFRFGNAFENDETAVQIGFMYPDESQMLGIYGNETSRFLKKERCGKVHPLEQTSMISNEDKKWGPTHAARVLLEFRAITYPPKVSRIPKSHGVELSGKFVFPEGVSLNIQRKVPFSYLPGHGDSMKWKDGVNIVDSHSFLRQTYDDDGRPVTTYGDVFRWFRPCRDEALQLSVKTIFKENYEVDGLSGFKMVGGFLKRIFVDGEPVSESWRWYRTDYIEDKFTSKNQQKDSSFSSLSEKNSTNSIIDVEIRGGPNFKMPILRAFKWKDEDKECAISHHLRSSSTDTATGEESGKTVKSSNSFKSIDGLSGEESEEYADENESIEDVLRLEGACVYPIACEDDLEDRVFCLRYFPVSCENARVVYFEVPTIVDCQIWIKMLRASIQTASTHFTHKGILKHSGVSNLTWQSENHRIRCKYLEWGELNAAKRRRSSIRKESNFGADLSHSEPKFKSVFLQNCVVKANSSNSTDLKLSKSDGSFLTSKRQRRSVSIRCSNLEQRQQWLRAIRVGITIANEDIVKDQSIREHKSTMHTQDQEIHHAAAVLHAPVALIVLSKKPISDIVRKRMLHTPLRQLFDGVDDTNMKTLKLVWQKVINLRLNVSLPALRLGYDYLWSVIRDHTDDEESNEQLVASSTASASGDALIEVAKRNIKEDPSINYLQLKTKLCEQFGDTLFTVMKKDVQDLLAQLIKPKIMNRVRELHSQGTTSYIRVRNDIGTKFGPRLLGLFKEEIRILMKNLSDRGAENVKVRRRSSLRKAELTNRFADEDGAVWEFLYANEMLLRLFTLREKARQRRSSCPKSPSTPQPAPPPTALLAPKNESKTKKKRRTNWLGNLKKLVFRSHDSEEHNEDPTPRLKVTKSDSVDDDDDDFTRMNGYPRAPKNPPRGWDDPVVISLYKFLHQELVQTLRSKEKLFIAPTSDRRVYYNVSTVLDKLKDTYRGIKQIDLEKNIHKIECGIEFMKVVEEALSKNDTSDSALTLAAIRIDAHMALERIVVAGMFMDTPIAEYQYRTMLHLAIEHGDNVKTVQVLLEAGVDVEAVDSTGTTPLLLAVKFGRKESLRLLILAGADVHRTDHEGKTPYSWAHESKKRSDGDEILKILVAAGARRHVFWSINTWGEHVRTAINTIRTGNDFFPFYYRSLKCKSPPCRSSTDHCWIVRKSGSEVSFRRRCQCCHLGLGLPDVNQEEEWMMEMLSRRGESEKREKQDASENEALDLLIAERRSMVTMSSVVWTLARACLRSVKESNRDVCETVRVEDMNSVLTRIWEFVKPSVLTCTMRIPRFDNVIDRVCRVVPSQTLIALFECLILDMKVVLLSDDSWRLADVCEAVMSLMYPLNIKDFCPSYFPLIMKDFDVKDILESPFNFCYGVLKQTVLDQNLLRVNHISRGEDDDANRELENSSAASLSSKIVKNFGEMRKNFGNIMKSFGEQITCSSISSKHMLRSSSSSSSKTKGRRKHRLTLESYKSMGIAETDHRIRAVPMLSDSFYNQWSDIPKFVTSSDLDDMSKFEATRRKAAQSIEARRELGLQKSKTNSTHSKSHKLLGITDSEDIGETMKARELSNFFHSSDSLKFDGMSPILSDTTSIREFGDDSSLRKVVRAHNATWRSLELPVKDSEGNINTLGRKICFIDLDVANGSKSAEEASRRATQQLQWGMLAAVERMRARTPYVGVLPKRIRHHLLKALHVGYGWNIDRTPLLSPVTLRSTCRFYDTLSTERKYRIITLSIRDEQIFASTNVRDLGRPVVHIRANHSEGKLYLHFTPRVEDIVYKNVPSPDTPTNVKRIDESLLKDATARRSKADLHVIDATLRHTMGELKKDLHVIDATLRHTMDELKNLVSPTTKRSYDGPVYKVRPREDEVDSVFAWLHDNAFRVSTNKCRIDFNEADNISFSDNTYGDVTFSLDCGSLDNRQQYIMVSLDDIAKPVRVLKHDGNRRIHLDLYGFASDVNLEVPREDKYRVLEYVLKCWSRFHCLKSSASACGTEVVINQNVSYDENAKRVELEKLRVRHERWTRGSKLGNLEDDWFGNPLDRALHVRHAFLESMASLLSPFFHTPSEFPDTFTLVSRGDPNAIRLSGINSDNMKLQLRLDVNHPGLGIGFNVMEKNHLNIVPSSNSIEVTTEIMEVENNSAKHVFLRLNSKAYVAVMPSRRCYRMEEDLELYCEFRKDVQKSGFVIVEDDMLRPKFVNDESLVLGLRCTFEDRLKHFCVSDLSEMTTMSRITKLTKAEFLEESYCVKGLGNLFERDYFSEMYDTSAMDDLKGSARVDDLFLRWIKRSRVSPSIMETRHGKVMARKWENQRESSQLASLDLSKFRMSLNAEIIRRFSSGKDSASSLSFMSSKKPSFDPPYLLSVEVCRASGLPSTDRDGSADPYVRLNCVPLNQSCDTNVCRNTLAPVWNQTIKFGPFKDWKTCRRGVVQFTVRDRDRVFDDNMGFCVVTSECFDVDTNYDEYVTNELRCNIKVKDRAKNLRKFKKVFLGSEACMLLVKYGFARHNDEAVRMGQKLLDAGFIQNASEKEFKDGYYFYRFVEINADDAEDAGVTVTELSLRNLAVKRRDSSNIKDGGKLFVRLRVVPGCIPG